MGKTDLQDHSDNDKDEQSSVSYTADDGRKINLRKLQVQPGPSKPPKDIKQFTRHYHQNDRTYTNSKHLEFRSQGCHGGQTFNA
ncbi:hypothetical protein L873DRAFT_1821697 [Choiromyces venosus 120613-1]|uniref:Uncharacterized protein n=1 Tax=Choiromyces venosus 120613-1 TaxID=1336337 RepID=A0A3N4IV82_9PEZI|nr:hypothetical protein L873DRAFT_1821697 [Choiromyces venosus 120613-1]